MAKTKTKGTAKTVSDTPVPQPITISSTNPKIMADNIKKLEKAIKGADDASEISYDNTESHLTASNVQAAIDEIAPALSPAAENVSYDNTDSGLTADDVQAAIDELAEDISSKKLKFTTLLNQDTVPTTAEAYSCAWQDYEMLSIDLCRYDNVRANFIVSKTYFSATSAGARVMIAIPNIIEISVYQNGNGSVYAVASTASAEWNIRIHGISIE